MFLMRRRLAAQVIPQISPRFAHSATNSDPNTKNVSTHPATPISSHLSKPVSLAYGSYEQRAKNEEKKKNTLLIHHSMLGCMKNWKKVAKEIHHITRRRVVSVDARNHGDSPHTLDMSYSLMAKDITLLLKELSIKKVDFLGHSMGGRVGMLLALTQPQVINRLICVDATPVNTPVSLERWKVLGEACQLLKDMEDKLREQQGIARLMLADKAVRPVLPNSMDRSLFLANLLDHKEQKQINSHSTSPKSPDSPDPTRLWRLNIDAFITNAKMPIKFPDFSSVSCYEGEALFVAGEQSKFIKKEHEEEIRRLFPNAKFKWVPNCGHWVHVERHKEFMESVVSFLETRRIENNKAIEQK